MRIRLRSLIFFAFIISCLAIASERIIGINISFLDDLILILSGVFFIAKIGLRSKNLLLPYFVIFIVVFLICGLVGQTSLLSLGLSLRSYMLPIVAYFIFSTVCDVNNTNKIYISFLLLFSLFLSVFGFWEYFSQKRIFNEINKFGEVFGGPFRIQSLIGNPVDYGYLLTFPFVYCVSYLSFHASKNHVRTKLLLSTSAFLLLSNVILTLSRGPILTLVITFFFTFWRLLFNGRSLKYILFIGALFSIAIIHKGDDLATRFVHLQAEEFYEQGDGVSGAGRLVFYLQSFKIIKDNPFFGVGPGQYGGWVSLQAGSKVYDKYDVSTFGISSIDLFLPHILGELGVIGSFCYFLIYLVLYLQFARRIKVARRVGTKNDLVLLHFGVSIVVIVVVSSLVTMIPETFLHMIIFWLSVGHVENRTNYLENFDSFNAKSLSPNFRIEVANNLRG